MRKRHQVSRSFVETTMSKSANVVKAIHSPCASSDGFTPERPRGFIKIRTGESCGKYTVRPVDPSWVILRSHPHTPGRQPFTNSFRRNVFVSGVWGSLGYLPRVCGQNHWIMRVKWICFILKSPPKKAKWLQVEPFLPARESSFGRQLSMRFCILT